MSFSSRSSQILTYEVLEPAFEYMKKNNLELDVDIFTQIVSMWKPEEEYFNWYNIWIPGELPRLTLHLEVMASCFNHHCLAGNLTVLSELHDVHKRYIRLIPSLYVLY